MECHPNEGMWNPALSDDRLQGLTLIGEEMPLETRRCTFAGVMNKTLILVGLAFLAALFTISLSKIWLPNMLVFFGLGSIITLILGLILCFKPEWANFLAPIYALAEGSTLGIVTFLFEEAIPGIGFQALSITFCATFACLFVYRSGVIDSLIDARIAMVGLWVVMGVLICNFIYQLLVPNMEIGLFGGGALGFGLSLLLLAFYLYVLLVDFKTVSQAVRAGMPQIYEWYLGYSILLTLVLVYLEVLRILNYLSRRR